MHGQGFECIHECIKQSTGKRKVGRPNFCEMRCGDYYRDYVGWPHISCEIWAGLTNGVGGDGKRPGIAEILWK